MSNDYLKIPDFVLSSKKICATSKILYGYISLLEGGVSSVIAWIRFLCSIPKWRIVSSRYTP